MKFLKQMTAAACALCLCAVYPAYGGFTGGLDSSAEDISDSMKWDALRIGGGGFVSSVVTGQKNMYARTDVGGAYKYNYETDSWEQLFGFLTDADRGLLSVSGIAIDPTDDDTVYFLCGCAYFSDAKTVIFKTTDGGKTFSEYDVTDMIQVHANGDGRECTEPIAVDPDNPDTIYAGGDVTAGDSCLIKSTDGGKTWNPVKTYDDLGLYKESINWPTWTEHKVRATENGAYNTQNGVCVVKVVDGKVYVGTAIKGQANIHVASVKDDKFEPLSKDLPSDVYPVSISYDGKDSLFFTYIGGLAFAGSSGGMYKYDLKSGTVKETGPTGNAFGTVYADKNDPSKLVTRTCGVWSDQWWSDEWTDDTIAWGDHFYRSEDGGDTWTDITPGQKGGNQYEGTDYAISLPLQTGGYDWVYGKACHWGSCMAIDPMNPDKVILSSGNGMFACDNVWDEKDVQFYFHPDGIEEVVALDFVSTTDGLDLSAIGDYDGFVHVTPDEIGLQYKPNMGSTSAIAVCSQNTDVWARIAEGDNGAGYYTTDRGNTWNEFSPAVKGGKLAIAEIKEGTYRIFNTGKDDGGVSYSDDWGKTWSKCDGIPSQYGSKSTMLFIEPDDPNTVYAYATYYNSSWFYSKTAPDASDAQYKFCVSTDGGKTFTSTDICMYDQCDSAGRIAYLEKGHVILGGGWYGMYDAKIDGSKVTVTKLDNIHYCKTVGYGAPEKEGGINTLYMYGKPQESDPEGIYRSTDGGKNWDCINTDHIYGGTGNGNFLVGDMDEFGKVYMSTVGCGIVYGMLSDAPQPSTKPDEKPTDAPADDILYGDANVDKKVTISDAVAILQSVANSSKYGLSKQGALNADCVDNGNGVTGQDAAGVQLIDAQVISQSDLPIKSSQLK